MTRRIAKLCLATQQCAAWKSARSGPRAHIWQSRARALDPVRPNRFVCCEALPSFGAVLRRQGAVLQTVSYNVLTSGAEQRNDGLQRRDAQRRHIRARVRTRVRARARSAAVCVLDARARPSAWSPRIRAQEFVVKSIFATRLDLVIVVVRIPPLPPSLPPSRPPNHQPTRPPLPPHEENAQGKCA